MIGATNEKRGEADPDDEAPESCAPIASASEAALPSIESYAEAIGAVLRDLELPERWADPLALHALRVAETNRSLNLTRLVTPDDVAHLQIEDSLRFASKLPLAGARVLDWGSGAGYPGVPIAYFESSAQVLLVDARRKKVEFLERVLAELGRKNLEARWGRVEQLLADGPRWDLVVARAVGSVAEVLRWLRPVRHRVRCLALAKGPKLEEELDAARDLLKPNLFRLREVEAYELAGGRGRRCIAFFEPGGKVPGRGDRAR